MRFAKGLYIYVSLKCIAIHSVAKYDLSVVIANYCNAMF